MYTKYPRTEHLYGSKSLDIGSSHKSQPLLGTYCVIEEKMDGIGLGIGFNGGHPYIQHRGHIYTLNTLPPLLQGFGQWVSNHEELLYTVLDEQFIMFGEWLEYKHTVFYNQLPDYFMEYDIADKISGEFLSTTKRQQLLEPYEIYSVHVMDKLPNLTLEDLLELLNKIPYSVGKNSRWQSDLKTLCEQNKINYPMVLQQTLCDDLFEGFYIKTENNDIVTGRYKWIRKSFLEVVLKSPHWKEQPTLLNQLK